MELKPYYMNEIGSGPSVILLTKDGEPYYMRFYAEGEEPEYVKSGEKPIFRLEGDDPNLAFERFMKFDMEPWMVWDDEILAYPETTYARMEEIFSKFL